MVLMWWYDEAVFSLLVNDIFILQGVNADKLFAFLFFSLLVLFFSKIFLVCLDNDFHNQLCFWIQIDLTEMLVGFILTF